MKETDVKIVAILLNFRCETVVGNVKTFPRYIQAWPHHATNTFFINCIARIKFFPYVVVFLDCDKREEEPPTVANRG